MRDYLQSIPLELEEAPPSTAPLPIAIFWSIVLPLPFRVWWRRSSSSLIMRLERVSLRALPARARNAQTLPLTVAAQNATRGPQWWYMSVLILIMITPVSRWRSRSSGSSPAASWSAR